LVGVVVAAPQLGVYRGPAPYGPNNMPSYSKWLNKDVVYALEFEAGDHWGDIEGGTWWLEPWGKWVGAAEPGKQRFLVISVPMVPSGESGVTLGQGASGAYDQHFVALAQNLVKYKLETSVIRIGWEFNGGWYPWSAEKDVKSWPIYWQKIVTAMKSVQGQKFQFCWCLNNGWTSTVASTVYPGDEYVDFIGVDSYDSTWDTKATLYSFGLRQRGIWYATFNYSASETVEYNSVYWKALRANSNVSPTEGATWTMIANNSVMTNSRTIAWADNYSGGYGLQYWSQWAATHNKPMTLNEWGVWDMPDGHGGGDNAYYIQQMHTFINDPKNNVAFYSYFDVFAFDGNHLLYPENQTPEFPKASAMYQRLFGA